MKRKLYMTQLASYLLFLAASFAAVLYLTPRLMRRYLYAVSDAEEYRQYIRSQSIAIQNVCYIMCTIILVLSLYPAAVFHLHIYRPLNKIILSAARYTDDLQEKPIVYEGDDELGSLAASLNYLNATVRSSGEYQRKFISNISHDFRSPLTSIKGYVEAMLDGTIPPEMQDKYLGIVLSETERLSKLTESILFLNTFDADGMYLEKTEFDLIPVINGSIDTLQVISRQKNIRIETSFEQPVLMVDADLEKIQRVLYNLIDNAIKFSGSDSSIQIRAAQRHKKVFVSVKDHGTGIAKENLPKIWDRFYKTDNSRGRDKKGTGLGLAIVKEIIRAHGQNINVISTEGVGTEFIFTLERAEKHH